VINLDDEINEFFSEFLEVECQLVRMPDKSSRDRREKALHF